MIANKDNHVRGALRAAPDGMRVIEIAKATERRATAIWQTLRRMPDAYIDRWDLTNGAPAAVWAVVVPPEHCPRPGPKRKRKA